MPWQLVALAWLCTWCCDDSVEIQFLSPSFLLITGLVSVVGARCLPRHWPVWIALAIGVGCTVVIAWLGLIPWLGSLHLVANGLLWAAAFFTGWLISRSRLATIGVESRESLTLVGLAMLGGMAGGRIRYLLEEAPASLFLDAHGQSLTWGTMLDKAVDLDHGGMVWYGGAVGGALAVILWLLWRRKPVLPTADALAPGVLLGLAIGRIGCFTNGCCYGAPCQLPWAIHHGPEGTLVHPTQLYETGFCTIFSIILAWWWSRRRCDGTIALGAVVGYACWRFFNESLRGDNVASSFWGIHQFTTSQVTSLNALLLSGIITLAVFLWRRTHPIANRRAQMVPGSRYAQLDLDLRQGAP